MRESKGVRRESLQLDFPDLLSLLPSPTPSLYPSLLSSLPLSFPPLPDVAATNKCKILSCIAFYLLQRQKNYYSLFEARDDKSECEVMMVVNGGGDWGGDGRGWAGMGKEGQR